MIKRKKNKIDFNKEEYYGSDYSYNNNQLNPNQNEYYNNTTNYNKVETNKSSYDDVYDSYNGIKKKKKNLLESKLFRKLVITVLALILLAGIAYLIYLKRDVIKDTVKDKIDDIVNKPAIEVKLLETSATIKVGDETKIKYEMVNFDDVSQITFTSSNPSVATVDNAGNVKGISGGTAVISLTYTGENGEVIKVFTVVVESDEVKVTATPTPGLGLTSDQKKQVEEAAKRAAEEAKRKGEAEAAKRSEEARKRAEEARKRAAEEAAKNR